MLCRAERVGEAKEQRSGQDLPEELASGSTLDSAWLTASHLYLDSQQKTLKDCNPPNLENLSRILV